MASVAKRPNGRWLARYRDAAGREHTKTFGRKVDGERWVRGQRGQMDRGDWTDPQRAQVTMGEWSGSWLAAQVQLKPSTRHRYESLLRVQVLPTWQDVPLSAVTHADVVAWVAGMQARGLAPATVRQAFRVLSLILALAVRDGRLSRNPADGAPLPRAVASEKRFLTHDEVARLVNAAGTGGLVIQVLAFCGLRYGEVVALRVRRVDVLRRRLEVAESLTEVNGKAILGTPKSHQRRSVPVPRSLADVLAVAVAGKGPDELVFSAPEGGYLRLSNFRRRTFDRAATDAGLAGLTPHQLRHTAASLAVSAGANVKAVQRMLGHASAAMTLDVYSGLFDDDLDAVADRMDAARISAESLRTDAVVSDLVERRTGR